MLSAKTFHLDTQDFDWDTAHLFEHLLIQGFYDMLPAHGYKPELIGWIDGDTFKDIIFIDSGFYEPEVAKLFDDYLMNLPEFTESLINKIVPGIECEGRSLAEITDMAECLSQLKALGKRKWCAPIDEGDDKPHVIKLKKSSKDFGDVRLMVSSGKLTESEQKLFLRAQAIIFDITTHHIRKHFAAYILDSTGVNSLKRGYYGFGIELVTKKSIDTEDIRAAAADHIKKYPVDEGFSQIKAHFDVFATEAWLQNAPVDYYRNAGIVTTNREIADLATVEDFEGLMSKLEVTICDIEDTESR